PSADADGPCSSFRARNADAHLLVCLVTPSGAVVLRRCSFARGAHAALPCSCRMPSLFRGLLFHTEVRRGTAEGTEVFLLLIFRTMPCLRWGTLKLMRRPTSRSRNRR